MKNLEELTSDEMWAQIKKDSRFIAVDEQPSENGTLIYQRVVLRPDQLDLIAEAVAKRLAKE